MLFRWLWLEVTPPPLSLSLFFLSARCFLLASMHWWFHCQMKSSRTHDSQHVSFIHNRFIEHDDSIRFYMHIEKETVKLVMLNCRYHEKMLLFELWRLNPMKPKINSIENMKSNLERFRSINLLVQINVICFNIPKYHRQTININWAIKPDSDPSNVRFVPGHFRVPIFDPIIDATESPIPTLNIPLNCAKRRSKIRCLSIRKQCLQLTLTIIC